MHNKKIITNSISKKEEEEEDNIKIYLELLYLDPLAHRLHKKNSKVIQNAFRALVLLLLALWRL